MIFTKTESLSNSRAKLQLRHDGVGFFQKLEKNRVSCIFFPFLPSKSFFFSTFFVFFLFSFLKEMESSKALQVSLREY